MITIPKHEGQLFDDSPGPWWHPASKSLDADGRLREKPELSAWVACPNGHLADLDHTIAADGTVSPSVVCPEGGCGWHEHVQLEGWQ